MGFFDFLKDIKDSRLDFLMLIFGFIIMVSLGYLYLIKEITGIKMFILGLFFFVGAILFIFGFSEMKYEYDKEKDDKTKEREIKDLERDLKKKKIEEEITQIEQRKKPYNKVYIKH